MLRLIAPLLVLAPVVLNAQLISPPVEAGESFVQKVGMYMSIEDSGSSDQVWDFSALVPMQTISYAIEDGPSSSLGKSFPNATHEFDDGSQQLYYSFDEGFTYHGGTAGALVVIYSDPAVSFPYPFAPGEVWEDTYACEYGAGGITVYRTGSVETECVSSGTLTLPGGQVHEDVYHIQSTEILLDSTFLGTYEITAVSDFYLSSDYSFALMGSLQVSTYDVPVGGTPVSNSSEYTIWIDSYVLGVEDAEPLASWAMMPNPASDKVTLVRPYDVSREIIEVVAMEGTIALRSRFTMGQQALILDVSGLPDGVYVVRSSESKEAQRLVITH